MSFLEEWFSLTVSAETILPIFFYNRGVEQKRTQNRNLFFQILEKIQSDVHYL